MVMETNFLNGDLKECVYDKTRGTYNLV